MDKHSWTFEWEGRPQPCSLGWAKGSGEGMSLLHPSELARTDGFPSHIRREGFRLGRIAGKRALSAWISPLECSQILIGNGAFGQPTLSAPYEISLSHSDTTAIAVASPLGFPMGIDIEALSDEPSRLRALEGQTTPQEQAKGRAHFANRSALLHGLWSAKEALSKVLRTGLGTSFTILEITDFSKQDGVLILGFRHFFQYSVVQFFLSDAVVSLAVPSQGKADWNAVLAPLKVALP